MLIIFFTVIKRDFQIEKAEQIIVSVLQRIPGLEDINTVLKSTTETMIGGYSFDYFLIVELRKQNTLNTLLVKIFASGQPLWTRTAVKLLLQLKINQPTSYGVFVAPYISERSAEICKSNGIGYIDLSGNCRLDFDGTYIEIKGNPNRFVRKSGLKSLFKPKAERILRVLLCEPERRWLAMELAEAADVSIGQVSNVRKLLLEREWIEDQKIGIKLIEPFQMLTSWLTEYQPDRSTTYELYDMGSVGDIESTIASFCNRTGTRYAFTGFSGASRYAPFTTYRTVAVYMDISQENITELPFKPVTSGANIRIISPYDDGVFYGTYNFRGQSVVSPVQCYLDLKDEKARGEEASEALLEQVIKPSWQ